MPQPRRSAAAKPADKPRARTDGLANGRADDAAASQEGEGSVRKTGRPSKYRPEFAEQAAKLCLLGATDAQLADFFGVAVSTVALWKVEHQAFSDALRLAKERADELVEQSLYRRAMGFEHDETDVKVIDGQVVKVPLRKSYPPDTTACIFWLKNRRPAAWRDKVETQVTGADGGPVQHSISVKFVE